MKKKYLCNLLLIGSIATSMHMHGAYKNFADEKAKIESAYKKFSSSQNMFDNFIAWQKNILDLKLIIAELEEYRVNNPQGFTSLYTKMFAQTEKDVINLINSMITTLNDLHDDISKTKKIDTAKERKLTQKLKDDVKKITSSAALAKKFQDSTPVQNFKANMLHIVTLLEKTIVEKISKDYASAKIPMGLVKTSKSRNLTALTQPETLTQKAQQPDLKKRASSKDLTDTQDKKEIIAPQSKKLGEAPQEPSMTLTKQPSVSSIPKAPGAPVPPPAPQPKTPTVKKETTIQPKPKVQPKVDPQAELRAKLQKKFGKVEEVAQEEKAEKVARKASLIQPKLAPTAEPKTVMLGKKIVVQGPPPMPGVLSIAEYEGVKELLGTLYNEFITALKAKDIRAKSWNTLTNDKEIQDKGAELAQLFKDNKKKFDEILVAVDAAKDGKSGASVISAMIAGRVVAEKKPTTSTKPVTAPAFNAMPYIEKMKNILVKDTPSVSPLLPGKLLNLKTEQEFKTSYKQATQKEPSDEALKLYTLYQEESGKIKPVGLTIEKKQQAQQSKPQQPGLLSIVQSKVPQGYEEPTKKTSVNDDW